MKRDQTAQRLPVEPALSVSIADQLKALTPSARSALMRRLDRTVLPGPELVAKALHDCGVRRLSGIMGTPADGIFAACEKRMRVLGFRHQMNAVLAASADNYASGALVHAVCVSAGPGIINSLTGVYFARDNHLPLLFLGTRRSLEDEGRGYFQELDAVPIMAPLTKWAATIRDPADLMPMIREGIQVAINGQPGPVFLDLPEDVIGQAAPAVDIAKPNRQVESVPETEVDEALKLLRSAKAPLVCLGEDLRWETNLSSLLAFLEREQIPWITLPMARGILPEDHPLCANRTRRRLPKHCDCFMLAGGWFDWRLRYGSEIPADAKIIHIHPDQTVLSRNIRAALEIKGQPGAFLNLLAKKEPTQLDVHSLRHRWIQMVEREMISGNSGLGDSTGDSPETKTGMPLGAAYRAVANCLPDEAIVTVDGNITLSYAQFAIIPKRPFSWFDPGWNGLIGGSLGLAIGLKLAHPDRPVIALMSDTSFGMSGMELETCARLGIQVTVIVGNNGGHTGSQRDRQWFPAGSEPISTFGLLPYHEIGHSLGADSLPLDKIEDIPPAVTRALSLNRPSCLNLILDPETPHPGFW